MTFGQQMMLGGGRPVVTIASLVALSNVISPVTATAVYRLRNDGDILCTGGSNTVNDAGDWLVPKQGMNLFECRFTLTSGALSSGTAGVWLNLGTAREWTVARSTDGTSTAVGTLDIGYAGTSTPLKSVTITIQAERFSP
jgi:hypothetical protein